MPSRTSATRTPPRRGAARTSPQPVRLPRDVAPAARTVLARDDLVATAADLARWGTSRSTTSRRVASGEWTRPFPGVVVTHSGPLTWRQVARAALAYAGTGAALSHRSAAFAHGIVATPGRTVHVSVPAHRRVAAQPGLVVHRRRRMPVAAGRLRAVGADVTVLDLVDDLATADDVVGLVCEVVRAGVRPGVVLMHAEERHALRHRGLLVAMLGADGLVERGVESPLEHRYLRDVERAHGLPPAAAQQRARVGGRWIRADRVHVGLGVRIELDGQLAHPHGRTDDDVWRDTPSRWSARS